MIRPHNTNVFKIFFSQVFTEKYYILKFKFLQQLIRLSGKFQAEKTEKGSEFLQCGINSMYCKKILSHSAFELITSNAYTVPICGPRALCSYTYLSLTCSTPVSK